MGKHALHYSWKHAFKLAIYLFGQQVGYLGDGGFPNVHVTDIIA
jgi:hypothetical protein